MNKKLLIILIAFSAAFTAVAAGSKPDHRFDRFKKLTGEWEAEKTTGRAYSSGEFSFHYDDALQALVRRNVSVSPGPDDRAVTHTDSMAVFTKDDGKTFEANYTDNESHLIHYSVSFEGTSIIFTSDAAVAATRFRLSYIFPDKNKDNVTVKFETAPPGQPEGFATYKEGTCHRKKQ